MPAPTERIEWPAGDSAARVLGASTLRRGPVAYALLYALEMLYGAGVRFRNATFDLGVRGIQRADIPVISVGNVVAGGAGKTPFTRWLVARIEETGRRVAVIHGGYAADEVELHRHWRSAEIVIEERDRVKAVATAAASGADIAVLDDAFQHRRLARDLDIVLVPAETHSSHMLPLGPLREPASSVQRADCIVLTRKTASPQEAHERAERLQERHRKPCAIAAILPARLRNLGDESSQLSGAAVIITAIARPDLLVEQVAALGINVVRAFAYPDHFEYRERDVRYLIDAAAGMAIITTEKDAIKLVHLMQPALLWIVEQKVVLEEGGDVVITMIEKVL